MTLIAIAFFASGFSALLCQVVWQRMLGIFAGFDTVSAALLVGAFLASLGLGSILGAKLADRLAPARALLGFALCETGVAAFALLSKPFLYDLLAIGLAGVVDSPFAVFALCFAGLVRRIAPDLVEAFRELPVADVSDCMSRMVAGGGALRPMHAGGGVMAGPAFTVRTRPGDNLMVHKALDLAESDDILVVDAGGDLTARPRGNKS
jgi:predicted membrane-bound spermidine synthase